MLTYINGRKGKTFLQQQPTKCRVTENHHLATIIMMTDSGKNNQWTLKSMCKMLMRNRIFTQFQTIYPKLLINFKGKKQQLIVEKSGRCHLTKRPKSVIRQTDIICSSYDMLTRTYHFSSSITKPESILRRQKHKLGDSL